MEDVQSKCAQRLKTSLESVWRPLCLDLFTAKPLTRVKFLLSVCNVRILKVQYLPSYFGGTSDFRGYLFINGYNPLSSFASQHIFFLCQMFYVVVRFVLWCQAQNCVDVVGHRYPIVETNKQKPYTLSNGFKYNEKQKI